MFDVLYPRSEPRSVRRATALVLVRSRAGTPVLLGQPPIAGAPLEVVHDVDERDLLLPCQLGIVEHGHASDGVVNHELRGHARIVPVRRSRTHEQVSMQRQRGTRAGAATYWLRGSLSNMIMRRK